MQPNAKLGKAHLLRFLPLDNRPNEEEEQQQVVAEEEEEEEKKRT